jgi:hypothetical protein
MHILNINSPLLFHSLVPNSQTEKYRKAHKHFIFSKPVIFQFNLLLYLQPDTKCYLIFMIIMRDTH